MTQTDFVPKFGSLVKYEFCYEYALLNVNNEHNLIPRLLTKRDASICQIIDPQFFLAPIISFHFTLSCNVHASSIFIYSRK